MENTTITIKPTELCRSFILNAPYPNFERDSFETLKDMEKVNPDNIDEGHISYCKETGKHYIYKKEYDQDNQLLSYGFELLWDNNMIQADSKEDLENYVGVEDLPQGQLAFCRKDKMMYYNTYPDRYTEGNETGYFKPLVNLADGDYITEVEFEDKVETVIKGFDFGTSGMVTYKTIEEMKSVDPKTDSAIEYGQIAFCEETELHYFCDNESNDNYGYFKLLSGTKVLKPNISNPLIWVKYNGEFADAIFNKKGEVVILKEVGEIAPLAGEFSVDSKDGEIDYSEFPYKKDNTKYTNGVITASNKPYGDEGDVSSVYCDENPMGTVDSPSYIIEGDQSYYYKAYFFPGETPLDSNGNELNELKWDRNREVLSENKIIINGTRPWYASTVRDGVRKQPLFEWLKDGDMVIEAELLETCKINQEFRIPLKIKKLFEAGPVSSAWNEVDLSEWEEDVRDNYYIYKYKVTELGHRGSVKIRVIF